MLSPGAGDARHHVLVYGTLRTGGRLHGLVEDARKLGERAVEGFVLYDTGLGFPAAVPGDGTVRGEVYAVDDATLARLDRAEDVPRLFTREEVEGVWVYVWAGDVRPGFRRIPAGEWDVAGAPP